jgi:hypothetical protein
MLQSDLKKVNEWMTFAIMLDSFLVALVHVLITKELKKVISQKLVFVCVVWLPWSFQNEPYQDHGYQSLTFLLQEK